MNIRLSVFLFIALLTFGCEQSERDKQGKITNDSAGGNSHSAHSVEDRISPVNESIDDIDIAETSLKAYPITNSRFDPPPFKATPLRGAQRNRQLKYLQMVNKIARQLNLEPEFVHAIISRESKYNTNAISKICKMVNGRKVCRQDHTTAHGLMQLMPDTSRELGLPPQMRRTHPQRNVLAGTKFLAKMKWAKGNLQAMAAGYNCGPARAEALLKKNTRSKYWRGAQRSTSNGVPGKRFWGGETYKYARHVAGFYLLYKRNPSLIGLTAKPYPSSKTSCQGGC